jgi:MFS family permease
VIGPVTGSWIADNYGFHAACYTLSAVMGIVAFLVFSLIIYRSYKAGKVEMLGELEEEGTFVVEKANGGMEMATFQAKDK